MSSSLSGSLGNDGLNFEFDASTPTLVQQGNIFATPTDMFTTPSFPSVSSAEPQNQQMMRQQYAKHLRKGMEQADADDYLMMFNKTPGDILASSQLSSTIVNVTSGHGTYTPQYLNQGENAYVAPQKSGLGVYANASMDELTKNPTILHDGSPSSLLVSDEESDARSASTSTSNAPVTRDGDLEFAHHQVKDKLANRTFLTCKRDNFTIVSPTNFTVVSNYIKLVQGFNEPVKERVPGGKGNTKESIPRQVVEFNSDNMSDLDPSILSVKCEVLGFDRKKNEMVALGQVTEQPFVQTSDNRWLAIFDGCIVQYSSHLHGQKLALRFTLMDRSSGQSISFVDSKTFQTITSRGKEKQLKKKRKANDGDEPAPKRVKTSSASWTVQEIRDLLDGYEKHNKDWKTILESYEFDSKSAEDLEAKVNQLFS